jgi:O-acetyl-ADP-ribose deacetylase (regulator of RNase III)
MATTYLSGDIIHSATLEVHGASARALAVGVSDSDVQEGLAIAVFKRWPGFADSFRAFRATKSTSPGDVFFWRDGDTALYALITHKEGVPAKFAAVERAVSAMLARANADSVTSVLLPRVGGGKGGVDWTRAKKFLSEVGSGSSVQLVVFEKFVRHVEPAASAT